MKIKRLITLIESLAMTGLISVGFSSWLIVEQSIATIYANATVENVVNNNDYLEIKNMSFSDYDSKGFYIDFVYDSNRSMTGYLDVTVDVNLQNFRKFVASTDKYKFNLSLITDSVYPINQNDILFYDLMINESLIYTYTLVNAKSSITYPSSGNPYNPSVLYVPNNTYAVNDISFTQPSNSLFSSITIENGSSSDTSLILNLKYSFTLNTDIVTAQTFFQTFALKKGVTFKMIASMEGL